MDDLKIVELYFERSESAIEETQNKYGKYCRYIAMQILGNEQDAEECVNDTYLALWNSIPPKRPEKLQNYLGALARNEALDKMKYNRYQKRSKNAELAIDELCECIPDSAQPQTDEMVFKDAIDRFLATLDKKARIAFMQRYFYVCPIKTVAENLKMSENGVKASLHRTRERLRKFLEKEGISI